MKKADRQKIFDKYSGKCAYCGCDLEKSWHVDELDPCLRNFTYYPGKWVKGEYIKAKRLHNGTYAAPENLNFNNQMPACASCNINKHSMSLEQFRTTIKKFVDSLNQYSVQYKIAKRYRLLEETNKNVIFYFETYNSI